jgi:putative membrane protein
VLEFLAHLIISAALLLVVAHFVKGITIAGWGPALIGALLLGIINALIRPVMVVLTLPITILTFGLFLLVVNALMFWLMGALVPGVKIERFGSAFFGALLLAVLNLLVNIVID